MSRQVWKGSTLLNPEPPVLVSCGAPEKPNLITVGWTGHDLHPAADAVHQRTARAVQPPSN